MDRQLTLIPATKVWQLDDETKASGRRGIASARAALAAHRPERRSEHRHDEDRRRPSAA